MANQNDTFDLKDLDLSMVEGFEGFGDDEADNIPIEEPVYDTPVEEPEDDEPIAAEDEAIQTATTNQSHGRTLKASSPNHSTKTSNRLSRIGSAGTSESSKRQNRYANTPSKV